ncbi:kinase-like protein [Ophiobolus disseminans]|uniref:Kinase-like protein n=1 Tax=Ophiobolus disseminans TaxID=1469910 RepID=A0A6A6ZJ46_9PLEO|nr:kinase-like protein [Ophiobolus disseminans]
MKLCKEDVNALQAELGGGEHGDIVLPRNYPPEIFIWHVFWHMTNACLLLRNSGLLGREYVHTDIKPLNVFIKEGTKGQWPASKTPALGDFGIFKILEHENIDSPAGTLDFMAPEQLGPYPNTPFRTDVFLIGLTIFCLMRGLGNGVDLERYAERYKTAHNVEAFLDEENHHLEHDQLYSVELDNLIEKCLYSNPASRISVPDLMEKVTAGRDAHMTSIPVGSYQDCDVNGIHPWDQVWFKRKVFDLDKVEDETKHRRIG